MDAIEVVQSFMNGDGVVLVSKSKLVKLCLVINSEGFAEAKTISSSSDPAFVRWGEVSEFGLNVVRGRFTDLNTTVGYDFKPGIKRKGLALARGLQKILRFTGQETRYPCSLGGKYEIDKEQLVELLRACQEIALGNES